MATIRKRQASWQVQIRRQGHPLITRSFKLKADAEAWARKIEAEIDRGDLPSDRRILRTTLLSELLIRYRDTVTVHKRGAPQETLRLNQFLARPISQLPLVKVTGAAIAQYRDERLKTAKGGTVRRELAIVQHLLELARTEWGYPLSGNPFDHVTLPAPGKARTRRVEPPELTQLLEGCEGGRSPLLEPIIRFAIETGMRRSELVNVRWQHLNFLNRTLHIPMTKNGHARTIPLSSEAIRVLRAVQESKFDPDRVFPLSPNAVRLAWVRLTKRTGVIGLCFHDLRHEAISRFFEKGLNMPEVALISGHRDMRMLHRYTHLRAEDVAKKLV